MRREPGVYKLPPTEVEPAAAAEERNGAKVFRLPRGITSKSAFFDAVCARFPLDPPLLRVTDNWDALDDSLGGGLIDVDGPRVVIAWDEPQTLLAAEPEAGRIALEILSLLPRDLRDPTINAGLTKDVVVLLGRP